MPSESLTTRDRILDVCLRLFNESGPVAVTTAEIARTVGINEGNLYYYFKKKEDILVALFERYEAAFDAIVDEQQCLEGIDDQGLAYLRQWFNLMWEWRFFYRDTAAIKRMSPRIRTRIARLTDRGQADIKSVLLAMASKGLLMATPDEIDLLVVNAWIICSYWLDYLDSRRNVGKVTRQHLEWGFAQVVGLFSPYTKVEGAG